MTNWGIWEATPQHHVDQFKPLETDNSNTGALGDQNEVELHLAGSKLGSYLPRLAGMEEFFLATFKVPFCIKSFDNKNWSNNSVTPHPGPHHQFTGILHLHWTQPFRILITPIM